MAFFIGLWVMAGCGDPDGTRNPPPDPDPTDLELSAAVFDPERVIEIQIEMDPADWDALRLQTRSFLDVIGSSCLEPPVRPFTYFPAAVTIDGQHIENIAVRKKGFFGSLDTQKPSLKLKLDAYIEGQHYSGVKNLTFNNNKSDPSHVRQCLGYWLFDRAGIPSPRCNFARVSVNGANLGVFTNVEPIKKQFLSRYFSNNSGNLYEGALSDWRTGWVDTFQRKTNKEYVDRSDIEALVPLMALPDAELLDGMAPLVDVDDFITFWMMERLIGHADGYARNTNNFYVYIDPTTGLYHFIPWGIDSTFWDSDLPLPWETNAPPTVVWSEGIITRRLFRHAETQPIYYERARELLDNVWIEAEIDAEIERMRQQVGPHVDAAAQSDFNANVDAVLQYVDDLRAAADLALQEPPPALSPILRDPWCIAPLGSVDGSFSTTWGTLGDEDPFSTGTGSLDITYGGDPFPAPAMVGSKSGIDAENGDRAVQILAYDGGEIVDIAHIVIYDGDFSPRSVPLDWVVAAGYLVRIHFDPLGGPATSEVLGILGDGMLTLSEGGNNVGDPVVGVFDAIIYEAPF